MHVYRFLGGADVAGPEITFVTKAVRGQVACQKYIAAKWFKVRA